MLLEAGLSAIAVAGAVSYLLAFWGLLPFANVNIPFQVRLIMLLLSNLAIPAYISLLKLEIRRKKLFAVFVVALNIISGVLVSINAGFSISDTAIRNFFAIVFFMGLVTGLAYLSRNNKDQQESANQSAEIQEALVPIKFEDVEMFAIQLPYEGSFNSYIPSTVAIRVDNSCADYEAKLAKLQYRKGYAGSWKKIELNSVNPRDLPLRWERRTNNCFIHVARPSGYNAGFLFSENKSSPDLESGFYLAQVDVFEKSGKKKEIELRFEVSSQMGNRKPNVTLTE